MSTQRPHTIWNRLALVAAVVGAALTVTVDQMLIHRWARSGVRTPLGTAVTVDLPAGDVLVFYESAVDVPTGNMLLAVHDEEGEVVPARVPADDNSFRMLLGGWSGRALWAFPDMAAGRYRILANNPNFRSNDEVPAGDRLVFAKRPATLALAERRRRLVQRTGAAITIVVVVLLYVRHLVALRGREAARRR